MAIPLAAMPTIFCPAAAQAQDAAAEPADYEHYQLRAELGAEYDSNAHRVEQLASAPSGLTGSFLQRIVVIGQLVDRIAPRQAIAVSATAAAKVFDAAAARSESVGIAQSSLMWRLALGPRAALAPSGNYYEAFQSWGPEGDPAGERRDFRSLAPALELRSNPSNTVDVGFVGGYRWLVFKPDRDFDFDGPTAGINLRWLYDTEGGADWEARAAAALEHRRFGGPAHVGMCPPDSLPCPGTAARADDFVMTQAEVTRTGRVLLGAGYAFHHNASNSFGETLIRHIAIARVATALPLGLYLAARADLLFAFYRDPIPVAQTANPSQMIGGKLFATIEDENRSSVRVDLSRDITTHVGALVRYTFYANELGGNTGTYRRHTLLLSLAFSYDK